MYQHDRVTQIDREYFCLNFGETKAAFEPHESPKTCIASPLPNPEPTGFWRVFMAEKDRDVAVHGSALEGVDLWVDSRLKEAFFLSDPLAKGLKAEKLTRRFKLRKCRLVG